MSIQSTSPYRDITITPTNRAHSNSNQSTLSGFQSGYRTKDIFSKRNIERLTSEVATRRGNDPILERLENRDGNEVKNTFELLYATLNPEVQNYLLNSIFPLSAAFGKGPFLSKALMLTLFQVKEHPFPFLRDRDGIIIPDEILQGVLVENPHMISGFFAISGPAKKDQLINFYRMLPVDSPVRAFLVNDAKLPLHKRLVKCNDISEFDYHQASETNLPLQRRYTVAQGNTPESQVARKLLFTNAASRNADSAETLAERDSETPPNDPWDLALSELEQGRGILSTL